MAAHSNHHRGFFLVSCFTVVAVAAFLISACDASSGGFGFDLHHRSSPVVRRWAEARGHPGGSGSRWPAHGSPEYYSALSRHDRALLARRGLAGGEDGLLTFDSGNETTRNNDLGFLYYAEVSVGTPKETFMVALDTGSDLFWVPCDCKQCAPINNVTAAEPDEPDLRPYSPRQSSTSKQVTCEHELCDSRRTNDACGGGGAGRNNVSSCPYTVEYVSANTSSSGVLVEDVLHLARDGEAVQAPVVFGCGQVQTGLFLGGPASDGLLGLGMDKVSVPSVLASKGLIASDSFSMCFSSDGVGRINFGDAGTRGQDETPFIVSSTGHPTYNVSFTSVNVGRSSAPVEFTAVMDSGTSFTYLNEPEYTALTTYFNLRVLERRTILSSDSANSSIPFEYCYSLSPGQRDVLLPEVSLTTSGGARFPVTRPIIVFGDEVNGELVPVSYCLGVVKNDISINIIGQNFMTGLKVVFDRQRSVLGWREFDCYQKEGERSTADEDEDDDASPRTAAPGPTTFNPTPPSSPSPWKYSPNPAGHQVPVWRPSASISSHADRTRTLGLVVMALLLTLNAVLA